MTYPGELQLSDRRWPPAFRILLLIVALSVLFIHLWLYRNASLDDAFISYRYSRNLTDGHGLVWNPGEDPIQGFTSIGWVLLNAGAVTLGFHPLVVSKILGALAAVGIVFLVAARSRHFSLGVVVATLILVFSPFLAFYAMSGMEHLLFTLLVAWVVLIRSVPDGSGNSPWLPYVLTGIASWIRPEAVGLCLLLVACDFVRSRMGDSVRWKVGLLWFFVLWIPLLTWKWWYFGHPIPNTYFAKHTGGGFLQILYGIRYVTSGFASYLGVPLAFVVAGVGLIPELRRRLLIPGIFFSGFVGYVVIVGGDDPAAFPSMRLLLPAFVISVIGVLITCDVMERILSRAASLVVAVIMVGLSVVVSIPDRIDLLRPLVLSRDVHDVEGVFRLRSDLLSSPEIVEWIEARVHPGGSVALPWAGHIPYYLDRRVIDLLGLNDEHIARRKKTQGGIDVKMDPSYVMAQAPDLVFLNLHRGVLDGTLTFEEAGGWRKGDRLLLRMLKESPAYQAMSDAPTRLVVFERRSDPSL